MLDVLLGAGLVDISAVVVRYFGGTLLGTGGLVRAYSDAVNAALAGITLVRPLELAVRTIDAHHAEAGRIEAELRGSALGVQILDVSYGASAVRMRVATADPAALEALIAISTGGRVIPREAGILIVDRPA